MPTLMNARFAGTCRTCQRPVHTNDAIQWFRPVNPGARGYVIHSECHRLGRAMNDLEFGAYALSNAARQSAPVASTMASANDIARSGWTTQPVEAPAVAPVATVAHPSVNLGALFAFMARASEHLRAPRLRLRRTSVSNGEIVLKLARRRSDQQRYVAVYVNRQYVGSINDSGTHTFGSSSPLLSFLYDVGQNPAAAVREYGGMTNHCSFCRLPLTDAQLL